MSEPWDSYHDQSGEGLLPAPAGSSRKWGYLRGFPFCCGGCVVAGGAGVGEAIQRSLPREEDGMGVGCSVIAYRRQSHEQRGYDGRSCYQTDSKGVRYGRNYYCTLLLARIMVGVLLRCCSLTLWLAPRLSVRPSETNCTLGNSTEIHFLVLHHCFLTPPNPGILGHGDLEQNCPEKTDRWHENRIGTQEYPKTEESIVSHDTQLESLDPF